MFGSLTTAARFPTTAAVSPSPSSCTTRAATTCREKRPGPLKRASGLLVLQEKLQATLGTVGGVRMLAHKESRVMFHGPLKILTAALGSAGSPIQQSVMNILSHYIRYEV